MNIRRFVITALKRFRQTYDESRPMPTLQQIVDREDGTSTITKTTGNGSDSRVTTSTTTIDAGSINQITTVEPVIGEEIPVKTYRGTLSLGSVTFTGPYKERARNVSSVTLAAQDGKSFFNMSVGGNPGLTIEIEEEPTRRHVVALSTKLKDSFKQSLGIDTIDTRVTANETALADRYTKAETDERIADALGNFDKLDYKVADSAPTPTTVVIDGKTETTQTGVRYMVKHQTDDRYEEYILIDGKIYDIGSTGEIDLSAYATTAAVNTALSGYATTEAMNTALAAKQNTLVSGTNIKTVAGESLLGSGNVPVSQVPTGGAAGQVLTKRSAADGDYGWQNAKPSYIVDKPAGASSQLGNVVQVGTLQNTDGTEYGIYEFYYRTTALPTADATIEYTLLPLLAGYNIVDFVDATGVSSNGVFIGNGRTDGTNRLIVQQFSKVRKAVILRAYQDYSAQTALLKIKFIGTKN